MTYESDDIAGLDALSPTVAAYKQFVSRQVGDPNVISFLLSRGNPHLAGLIAKKARVDNAAAAEQQLAQQPPSAPPTVAQRYDMAAAQLDRQNQMMASGLGGMPNPVMQNARFAGGGIVAFDEGGGVGGAPAPLTAQEQNLLEIGRAHV